MIQLLLDGYWAIRWLGLMGFDLFTMKLELDILERHANNLEGSLEGQMREDKLEEFKYLSNYSISVLKGGFAF